METLKSIKLASILEAIETEAEEIKSELLKVYESAKSGEIKTAAARRVFNKELTRVGRLNRWAAKLSVKSELAKQVHGKVFEVLRFGVEILG